MDIIISLDKKQAEWLITHIRGGFGQTNRSHRSSIRLELTKALSDSQETITTRQARSGVVKVSSGTTTPKTRNKTRGMPKGTLNLGTCAAMTLEAYELYPDGLTANEAAGLSGYSNFETALAASSDHKRRGFIRIIGRRDGKNLLSITPKGRVTLKNAREKAAK